MDIRIARLIVALVSLTALAQCGEADGEHSPATLTEVTAVVEDCNGYNSQAIFRFTILNEAETELVPLAISFEGQTDPTSGEVLMSGEKSFEPSTVVPASESVGFYCAKGVSFSWPEGIDPVIGTDRTYRVRATLSYSIAGETRTRSVSSRGELNFYHNWDACDQVFVTASDCHVFP